MNKKIKQELLDFSNFLNEGSPQRLEILNYLKQTSLPFLACYQEELSSTERFDYSFQYLHLLGQHNLPLAVGLCMNQYIAFSISCLPVLEGTPLHALKNQFLSMVKQNNWLLAVSNFDDLIRNKNESVQTVNCVTQDDGTIVCHGTKNFQSNVSASDVLLFTGILDGKDVGLFYTPLNSMPGITLGDVTFAETMADADTRTVTFDGLQLQPQQAIPTSGEEESLGLHALTRVAFAVMAMAPYLGAAKRSLDEASEFLNSVHLDGEPLAALDGYITDMGRAKIKYQLCIDLVDRFVYSIESINADNLMQWISEETPKTLALKHHVASSCEELVSFARKVIGIRSMLSTHIISKLSVQIGFGALHPVSAAKIERQLGAEVLNNTHGND
jgi:hypothetical protein